jgi:hypothetical protein
MAPSGDVDCRAIPNAFGGGQPVAGSVLATPKLREGGCEAHCSTGNPADYAAQRATAKVSTFVRSTYLAPHTVASRPPQGGTGHTELGLAFQKQILRCSVLSRCGGEGVNFGRGQFRLQRIGDFRATSLSTSKTSSISRSYVCAIGVSQPGIDELNVDANFVGGLLDTAFDWHFVEALVPSNG